MSHSPWGCPGTAGVVEDAMIDLGKHGERVLVLDFGSQVTQLIARRLRESGIYCEVWPFDADPGAAGGMAAAGG